MEDKRKNVDYLDEGFDIVNQALRKIIVEKEKLKYGPDQWWFYGIRPNLRDDDYIPEGITYEEKIKNADFAFLSKVAIRGWRDLDLTYDQSTYLKELQGVRNKRAHLAGTDITLSVASRALDTIWYFLNEMPEFSSEAEKVRNLENELSAKDKKAPETDEKVVETEPLGDTLPSWRTVVSPRSVITKGEFNKSTFALDLSSVVTGGEGDIYGSVDFFEMTYMTGGLKALLKQVARRLNGENTDAVVEVKTTFGGGKSHSMLAAYYMAKNSKRIDDLRGVRSVLNEAEIETIPEKVATAVIVGTNLSTTKTHRVDGAELKTMWGEIAYQISRSSGRAEIFEDFRQIDRKQSNPTISDFSKMFELAGPTLIIIDELVAYARTLDGNNTIGGTFDSFMTGMQALTEAVAKSKNAILLCSIPESDVELGGERGKAVAASLSKVVSRVAAPWQTATEDESFNIVSRRLFEKPTEATRDKIRQICEKYMDYYKANDNAYPEISKNPHYIERLIDCYPFHPTLFDDLYNKWGSLENFQRTRSVLALLSYAVYYAWNSNDQSPLITPGNLPLDRAHVKEALLSRLDNGAWNSVLDSEFVQSDSNASQLDKKNPNFGEVSACKKLSAAIFMGSPNSNGVNRGITAEEAYLAVGSPNDGIGASVYKDALLKIVNTSAHINVSEYGQKYFFDTAPSLNKAIDQYKSRVRREDAMKALRPYVSSALTGFSALNVNFWPNSEDDVPDDDTLRIVILPLGNAYSTRAGDDQSNATATTILLNHRGNKRQIRNRLFFLAPDYNIVQELIGQVSKKIALDQIENDPSITQSQKNDIKGRKKNIESEIHLQSVQAYRWLMVPKANDPSNLDDVSFKIMQVDSNDHLGYDIEDRLKSSDSLIPVWNGDALTSELKKYYFKDDADTKWVKISELYSAHCKYLYLPRLESVQVLVDVVDKEIDKGTKFGYAASLDDKGTPEKVKVFGHKAGFTGSIAQGYIVELQTALDLASKEAPDTPNLQPNPDEPPVPTPPTPPVPSKTEKPKNFVLTANVKPDESFVQKAMSYYQDVIARLGGNVKVTIKIEASDENGFDEETQDLVDENSESLEANDHKFF